MKKVTIDHVNPYFPPLHFNMTALKLHGKDETGLNKFWCGMSYFLPNGGAEWAYDESPTEKIYFVLDGQITVTSKTEEFVLNKGDSICILPFEGRKMLNRTNFPATVLVIVSND